MGSPPSSHFLKVGSNQNLLDNSQVASSKDSIKFNKNKQILAKKEKMPTLADQMEVVDEWWREVDPQMKLEAPTGLVAELFVKKGLAQDEEFAKKILQKNMQNKAKMVSVEDFNQIFCKNIFKDALIAITT